MLSIGYVKYNQEKMLYEMEGVSEEVARQAFKLASAKLPSTTFVSRQAM